MNQKIKISQLPAKGSNLAAADLLEIAEFTGTGYISKSITGQEIIDAIPLPPSGITIGTTAITSGTVGRVLFEGTGNVVQESANLFWDNTNGRLGIGGVTPFYNLIIYNASAPSFALQNSSRVWQHYLSGSNYRFGTSAADMINIAGATGNVGINTFTDAGFRLDVNGTARVSDNVLLTNGIIATSGATTRLQGSLNYFTHNRIASSGAFGFQIATSGTVTSFWRWDTGTYDLEIGSPSGALSQNFKLFTAGSERMRLTAGGNVLINTTTDAGFRLDVNGSMRATTLTSSNPVIGFSPSSAGVIIGSNQAYRIICDGSNYYDFRTNTGIIYRLRDDGSTSFGSTTIAASAMVDIQSTTKGFLPPRMTTTQKNAIATPATGLQVYDTTLNRPCFYDGTSWITL